MSAEESEPKPGETETDDIPNDESPPTDVQVDTTTSSEAKSSTVADEIKQELNSMVDKMNNAKQLPQSSEDDAVVVEEAKNTTLITFNLPDDDENPPFKEVTVDTKSKSSLVSNLPDEVTVDASKASSLLWKIDAPPQSQAPASKSSLNSERSERPKFVPPPSATDTNGEDESLLNPKSSSTIGMRTERSTRSSTIQKLPMSERAAFLAEMENKRSHFRWYHAIFFFSIISLTVCLLQLYLPPPFGVMMTSAQVDEVGVAPGCEDELEHCICPRETICATNTVSIVLLTLARCSAFFDYPLYMMMFLTKCHNLNNICRRTILRERINFADMHKVHKLFGVVVGIETMSHSFFHMLRWGLNGDISILWETRTGITGLVAMIITPLVAWPMVVPVLKQNMQFELRKGLHYLAVVWALALCWHAPSRIYYLIGVPLGIYALDYLFGLFIRNTLIEDAHFERYGENGVALYFKNPQKWGEKPKTSYVYIMCPWISKNQWHAFTMFPEPTKENHTMLCIGASGDWTKKLHSKINVPGYKSLYVLGPYLSEFSDRAVTTSNAIAVASGIGITPTLSLMLNYSGKKRVNIIWMCRDAGLVEYILHKVDIEAITMNSYAFIYYTGKRELALPKNLPVNLFIFKSRPNLEQSITGIVTSIHTGEDLPEEVYDAQSEIASAPFHKRMQVALGRLCEIYGADEMFEYAVEQTQMGVYQGFRDSLASDDPEAVPLKGNPRRHSKLSLPDDAVSLKGLNAMVTEFCGGIGEYSQEDLKEVFDQIDRYKSGYIDREDFDAFLIVVTKEKSRRASTRSLELASHIDKLLMKSIHQSKSMRGIASQAEKQGRRGSMLDSVELMKSMIHESRDHDLFKDWSVFYCGGSDRIKKNLKEISKKYGLAFAVEKFDW